MSADVAGTAGEALAVGRFILLYDPHYSDVWDGNFRIVTYIRTSLESDLGEDPLVSEVLCFWWLEPLMETAPTYGQPGGEEGREYFQGFGWFDKKVER